MEHKQSVFVHVHLHTFLLNLIEAESNSTLDSRVVCDFLRPGE